MSTGFDRITALIFDLGGVLIDLAPERTLNEFALLAQKPVAEILNTYTTHSMFTEFETGKIGAEEFRNSVRTMFDLEASDAEIDRCWNAMIIDLPAEKLALLTRLKQHFTTIVLSNTNSIHLAYINDTILKGDNLDNYVHQAHYSHQLRMRKPDPEIFEYILKLHSLTPEQILFMDDNPDNIHSAKTLKIEARLIEHPSQVISLFENYA